MVKTLKDVPTTEPTAVIARYCRKSPGSKHSRRVSGSIACTGKGAGFGPVGSLLIAA